MFSHRYSQQPKTLIHAYEAINKRLTESKERKIKKNSPEGFLLKMRENLKAILNLRNEFPFLEVKSQSELIEAAKKKYGSSLRDTLEKLNEIEDLNQKESLSFATFAPSYIDHVSNSLRHNRPITLAKIFGKFENRNLKFETT